MTSVQSTAARSVAFRAAYVSNRAMNVWPSREMSLFVSARPGTHPVVGSVNVAVSEMAIDCLIIAMAAAITTGYGEYVGVASVSTFVCSSMMTALSHMSAR